MNLKPIETITQNQLEQYESLMTAARDDEEVTTTEVKRLSVSAAAESGWFENTNGIPHDVGDMPVLTLNKLYINVNEYIIEMKRIDPDFLSKLRGLLKSETPPQPSST